MTRVELKQGRVDAQTEYDSIRQQAPSPKALLISHRLVVLPNRVLAMHGGAAVIYGWLCVSPKLLGAPASVRNAILAHEWGHVASGHHLATIGAFSVALVYALATALPQGWPWNVASTACYVTSGGLLVWAMLPTREAEADALASRLVGPAALLAALRWLRDNVHGGQSTKGADLRMARLATQSGQAAVAESR